MVGAKQKTNRKFQLERLLGREVKVILVMDNLAGKKNEEIVGRDIVEKREIPGSNFGYYLQRAGVHIPLSNVRINHPSINSNVFRHELIVNFNHAYFQELNLPLEYYHQNGT